MSTEAQPLVAKFVDADAVEVVTQAGTLHLVRTNMDGNWHGVALEVEGVRHEAPACYTPSDAVLSAIAQAEALSRLARREVAHYADDAVLAVLCTRKPGGPALAWSAVAARLLGVDRKAVLMADVRGVHQACERLSQQGFADKVMSGMHAASNAGYAHLAATVLRAHVTADGAFDEGWYRGPAA